jgi:MoxR-like ATPase
METLPDARILQQMIYQVKRVIVGQDALIERLLVALLARGHVLVEGVPGLAKTMAIKTLAQSIGGEFQRIQFTPDLVPSDLIGTRIYNQKLGEFQTSLGPVFANLLLADEINRAPAKVQSALLEVMQERQVTIGRESNPVPDPFLVMATQNPIESEGTYQLPEAQLDRFMLKVLVGYPSPTEEFVIVERMTSYLEPSAPVIDIASLRLLQRNADAVYVDPSLIEYAVKLAGATRDPGSVGLGALANYVTFGASPRASINMILAAKALAVIRGRDYAIPEDVRELAPDVLRHRLVLSYEALADDVKPDHLINQVLGAVRLPEVSLRDRPRSTSSIPLGPMPVNSVLTGSISSGSTSANADVSAWAPRNP